MSIFYKYSKIYNSRIFKFCILWLSIFIFSFGKIWLSFYVLFVIHLIYLKAYRKIPMHQSTEYFTRFLCYNFAPSTIQTFGKYTIFIVFLIFFFGYEVVNSTLTYLNARLGKLYLNLYPRETVLHYV